MANYISGDIKTPSVHAKSMGLKSIKQVTDMTGVSQTTLHGWHRHKPRLFAIALKGCVAEITESGNSDSLRENNA